MHLEYSSILLVGFIIFGQILATIKMSEFNEIHILNMPSTQKIF